MGEQENYGMALDILFQTANTMHMMTTVLQMLPEKMAHGYQHFFQNWAPLINDLHTLAPDATIVAVGLYNPFNESKLTENSALTIGKAAIAEDPVAIWPSNREADAPQPVCLPPPREVICSLLLPAAISCRESRQEI